MADSDTLDHRAELMRVWSADRALMAQAGLLPHAVGTLDSTFLAAKTPAELLAKRNETKAKRASEVQSSAPVNHTNKKKKNKSNLKTETAKIANALRNLGNVQNNKKKKRNTHIITQSIEDLDSKVGSQFAKYKTELESSYKDIADIIGMIPRERKYGMLVQTLTKDNAAISKFTKKENNFDDTYMKIAHGTYKFVTSVSILFKKSNHKYYYPTFFDWQSEITVLQKGFFVHELLTMLHSFLQRNSAHRKSKNDVEATETTDAQLHDLMHVLMKYKGNLDKTYSTMKIAKENLHALAKQQRLANPRIDHSHLKNLKADIEETLHSDGTFHMGHPYE